MSNHADRWLSGTDLGGKIRYKAPLLEVFYMVLDAFPQESVAFQISDRAANFIL